MTEAEILDDIRTREGTAVKNDPADPADPSKYGIGAPTLGAWRDLGRRATLDEISGLTWSEAQRIYQEMYIERPGFTAQNIPFEPLRLQLIDFGVNSGPSRAIRSLQRLLGVTPTGTMSIETVAVLSGLEALHPPVGPLVNDALVAARLHLIDTLTDTRPGYKKYEEGLESRALSFFLNKD